MSVMKKLKPNSTTYRAHYFISVFLVFIFSSLAAHAESQSSIASAFIYKFTSFIEWPKSHPTFNILVVEDDELSSALTDITKDKKVLEAPINVHLIGFDKLSAKAADAQIVVFPRGNASHIKSALEKLRKTSALTITFDESPSRPESIINFISENDSLRFEIKNTIAEAAHLKISSRLLKLSKNLP